MSWFEWLLGSWPKKDDVLVLEKRESGVDDPAEYGESSMSASDAEWEDEFPTGAGPGSDGPVLDEKTDMVMKADVICMNHRVVSHLLENYENSDALQRVIDAVESSTRSHEVDLGLVRRRNRFTSR